MRPVAMAVLAALVSGCGETGPTPLPPAPTAVVTLDGKPAAGLSLRLLAADGSSVGGGSTGPDGRTDLRGLGGQPVPPGTYKVVVLDLGEDEPDPMAERPKGLPKSRVPAVYAKPATTSLTVTLAAGPGEHPLALKSKL